ncbi:MAG: phasin family protein [Pseudomonadota bacterium]
MADDTQTIVEDTKKAVDTAVEGAQEAVEKTVTRMGAAFEDIASFNQATLDALVVSSRVSTKAFETLNAQVMAFAKRSYEEGVAAAKEIGDARSVTDLVERQSRHASAMAETALAEMVKLNDILGSATRDTVAPISEHVQTGLRLATRPLKP